MTDAASRAAENAADNAPVDREAFSRPLAELGAAHRGAVHRKNFHAGRAIFRRVWVTVSDTDPERDGLGPLYNRQSCSGCHVKDGRGRPPQRLGGDLRSMVVRVATADGSRLHPVFGRQLQVRAIVGVRREGRVRITYEKFDGQFAGDGSYRLRAPRISWEGHDASVVRLSSRVAPALVGMGLLEAVDAALLESLADPDDADGDGISGRLNRVWDQGTGRVAIGRFGWKAGEPSIRQQIARALAEDMGITTALFPEQNCPPAGGGCPSGAPDQNPPPEMADAGLDALVTYVRGLGPPPRRNRDDPGVVRGGALFDRAGCPACHRPRLATAATAAMPVLAARTIHPYTDLLLHNMGPGLADGFVEGVAQGNEWRTAPLWGIGRVETVNGHRLFLHDGRAEGLMAAILWHGGEAMAAREAVRAMTARERGDLVRFLKSL